MKTRLTPDSTIEEMVASQPEVAGLIASIGMNPELHPGETIRAVCQRKQWNEVELIDWINRQLSSGNGLENGAILASAEDSLAYWHDQLVSEIEKNRKLMNRIRNEFPRVHDIHGNQYTWLKDASWHVGSLYENYRLYSDFELRVFLPGIRSLEQGDSSLLDGLVRKLSHGCDILETDREKMNDTIRKIRKLASGFRHPEGSCTTMRILNQTFLYLFDGMMRQFGLEKKVIPLVRNAIASI